jgi:hypothetical protein
MTEQVQPETPFPQLFKDNPMYQELMPNNQRAVDSGIQEELRNIDRNRILTPAQKEEEKTSYLEEGALVFLESMWKVQRGNRAYADRFGTEKTARTKSEIPDR